MPSPTAAGSHRNRGFALLIVLWTLVLIAFITAHIVASGRVEIRIAGNLVANATTDAAADGAVYQAIFNLMNPDARRRWPLDGSTHEITLGNCRVTVLLRDEAALINPNLASPALLEALLRATGSDAASAQRLADSIGEWVGAPIAARTQDAMLAEYRAAGLDYAPPGEPLETIGELRRVVGMTPAVFAAIRPHLSLFAPAQPSLEHADPVVAAAMAAIAQAAPGLQRQLPLPQQSDILSARIVATAAGPSDARATRTAVVRLVPRSGSYVVLAWGRDAG